MVLVFLFYGKRQELISTWYASQFAHPRANLKDGPLKIVAPFSVKFYNALISIRMKWQDVKEQFFAKNQECRSA
jgi:hypothetical protein